MRKIVKRVKVSLYASALLATTTFISADFITIGTGGVTGTYYPTGSAICRFMNFYKKTTGIRCLVESTGGSVYNVQTLNDGEFDFAFSQSDTLYQAYHGEGKFANHPMKHLRSVMAIYPELLAFVVNKKSTIKKLSDITNKRVNIDTPGSGTRMTTETLLNAFGIEVFDLAQANEINSFDGPQMLKEKTIDGYFGVFGHPTANIQEAASLLDIDLIPIEGKAVDALVAKHTYYTKGVIPKGLYRGINHDTATIGVKAILATKDSVDENSVYLLTTIILKNFDAFKKLHPALKNITKESLLKGLTIPQHRGAMRAFKENGVTK